MTFLLTRTFNPQINVKVVKKGKDQQECFQFEKCPQTICWKNQSSLWKCCTYKCTHTHTHQRAEIILRRRSQQWREAVGGPTDQHWWAFVIPSNHVVISWSVLCHCRWSTRCVSFLFVCLFIIMERFDTHQQLAASLTVYADDRCLCRRNLQSGLWFPDCLLIVRRCVWECEWLFVSM